MGDACPTTTTTDVTCRRAVPADAAAVQRLVKSAYRGESSRAGWTTEADLVADDRIDVAGVLAKMRGPGFVLVAHTHASDSDGDETAPVLVGCCEVQVQAPDGHVGYFGLFAVDPRRQGGGLGRTMLARAEHMAREELGVRTMEMSVIWTRGELIAWYVRRGYVETGRTAPFPYRQLINGKALRDDLYFVVLEKTL
ncbi:hypothetical protein E4U42_005804 [Claviceps africana]|uniref:N-acetyltransferase domain-containing protein n=1 Tax=Claviceps africana TaxID=83212 RepID=A0A8K0J353_9HYPO|nr:hypothetical protein E4U42_005804 [Claviceps africana]